MYWTLGHVANLASAVVPYTDIKRGDHAAGWLDTATAVQQALSLGQQGQTTLRFDAQRKVPLPCCVKWCRASGRRHGVQQAKLPNELNPYAASSDANSMHMLVAG